MHPLLDLTRGDGSETARVLAILRQEIVLGGLAPGTRLVHEDLARRFGVSRTPVREALRVLETEGLLMKLPGGRLMILSPAQMTCEEMADTYELRAALEGYATAQAISRMSPDDLLSLIARYKAMSRDVREGRLSRFPDNNREFHFAVFALAGNARLEAELRNYWTASPLTTVSSIERRSADSVDEHDQIIAAIRAGDRTAALLAAQRHVASAAHLAIDSSTHDGHAVANCRRKKSLDALLN